MYVLGVWDGHDAGAALLQDGKIVFAANEERYTKRKLEIKFPFNSIKAALDYAKLKPTDIDTIAFPTTEFAKTASRLLPYQQEVYYKFRRRKLPLRPKLEWWMHYMKYAQTGIGVLPGCDEVSKYVVSKQLRSMGFDKFKLYSVDHHVSHATGTAFTCGWDKALVITMDGLGDGLCGSISVMENGKLERKRIIHAKDSIGIFYEQVTNIVGMRELEDEGKVMAMADYSFPFKFEDNKLKDFYTVNGTEIKAKYGAVAQYDMLSRLAWTMPREQFAYMAQQLLENVLVQFVQNAVNEYGIGNVALSGGLFANVKANMKIRNLDGVKQWYIFPHMGDGGIALGAAMQVDYTLNGTHAYPFDGAYLGNEFDDTYTEAVLKADKSLAYEADSDKASHAADLIGEDNYVFWYQGRMEYGPRALGDRSILAKASSEDVKDKLNIYVKQREWYQPFAPSMLRTEADKLLDEVKGYDRFMTMAYKAKEDKRDLLHSVVHVDMTARPQMVGDENPNYRDMLTKVKKKLKYGVVLNTSFNIHGQPIVMSPEDAIMTMKKTQTRYMFLNGFFVENKEAAV